jgi:CHAD domain-containing protein
VPRLREARDVVRRELKKARASLTERWPLSDRAVHDARKRLKKARAALRLMREEVDSSAYRRENRALRDAARPLSQLRDATVLVRVFDRIAKPDRVAAAGARRLRARLVKHQLAVRGRVLHDERHVNQILRAMKAASRRLDRWPEPDPAWRTVDAGLRRTYRSGRDALDVARRAPTPGRLHEWRKQAKYLRHQLKIIEPIRPRRLRRLGDEMHRLSTLLGNDHDLDVLRQRLGRMQASGTSDARAAISREIARRSRKLRTQAVRLGARLYAQRARVFSRSLEQDWRAWRSEKS